MLKTLSKQIFLQIALIFRAVFFHRILLFLLLVGSSFFVAHAADQKAPSRQEWSFSGPFGLFDRAQLQRGFKVYREVCSSCHSVNLLAFRNLAEAGGPEFTPSQIKALASTYMVKDGPNEQGEMFERPGQLADYIPSPYANEKAARASNAGAYPPDFSTLAKARTYERGFPWFLFDIFTQYQEHGIDYIHALLRGYTSPPAGVTLMPGQYWNEYMPGNLISMAPPLTDGQVEYPRDKDGKPVIPETLDQYAKDVAAFMMWVAEPHMEARKSLGFKVISFLLVFAGLVYFTKKKIWSKI